MFPSTPQQVVEKVVVLAAEGTFPRLRMREGQTSQLQDNHMPGMVDETHNVALSKPSLPTPHDDL